MDLDPPQTRAYYNRNPLENEEKMNPLWNIFQETSHFDRI